MPDAKLIVLLRNPVDRAYSHYKLATQRHRRETLSFAEALEKEPERLKDLPRLQKLAQALTCIQAVSACGLLARGMLQ